jgi:hypothetical protein
MPKDHSQSCVPVTKYLFLAIAVIGIVTTILWAIALTVNGLWLPVRFKWQFANSNDNDQIRTILNELTPHNAAVISGQLSLTEDGPIDRILVLAIDTRTGELSTTAGQMLRAAVADELLSRPSLADKLAKYAMRRPAMSPFQEDAGLSLANSVARACIETDCIVLCQDGISERDLVNWSKHEHVDNPELNTARLLDFLSRGPCLISPYQLRALIARTTRSMGLRLDGGLWSMHNDYLLIARRQNASLPMTWQGTRAPIRSKAVGSFRFLSSMIIRDSGAGICDSMHLRIELHSTLKRESAARPIRRK